MAWGEAEWAQVVAALIGGGIGGTLASFIQSKLDYSNTKKTARREKLEAIASLSVEAESYIFNEQRVNTYSTQMIAFQKQTGTAAQMPKWVQVPEPLPHKTRDLENLVRQYLDSQFETVRDIRRLEGKLQETFAAIQQEISKTQASGIDAGAIGLRCISETNGVIEKIKSAHDRVRKAVSTEIRKYS